MFTRTHLFALGASLLLGTAGITQAADSDMRAELEALKAEVAELRGQQNETWLNERRAEEVKALVREVLADADSRASLLEDCCTTAGHNGENFWIGSEDGSFLLKIYGQIQVRHNMTFRNGERGGAATISDANNVGLAGASANFDQAEAGFEVRRAKVGFAGHISSPRFQFDILLSVDHGNNEVYAERITIHYEISEGFWIGVGEDKDVFLREELIESGHQLAVERSLVNEAFTNGIVQGVWMKWQATDNLYIQASIHDGPRSGEYLSSDDRLFYWNEPATAISEVSPNGGIKSFDDDASDFAFTARVDWLVMGDWNQLEDFTAWSGQDTNIAVGAAVSWHNAESGDDNGLAIGGTAPTFGFTPYLNHDMDILSWTFDISAECHGFNVFFALVGRHIDDRAENFGPGGTEDMDMDQFGIVLQGGYQVIPDKLELFVRWEWMDLDIPSLSVATPLDALEDEINLMTFGVNWYINKHQTKFSFDVVWALDTLNGVALFLGPGSNLGDLGLMVDRDNADSQVAIRSQLQLLF